MVVVGATWSPQESILHINTLEAIALQRTVSQVHASHHGGHISVWVDNTSVMGAARKQVCAKNRLLNDAVVEAVATLKALKCTFSIDWVSTHFNPADIPSRVPPASFSHTHTTDEISLAIRKFLTSDGVGGGRAVPGG